MNSRSTNWLASSSMSIFKRGPAPIVSLARVKTIPRAQLLLATSCRARLRSMRCTGELVAAFAENKSALAQCWRLSSVVNACIRQVVRRTGHSLCRASTAHFVV